MRNRGFLLTLIAGLGLVALAAQRVAAQDPVKVDPQHFKVLFENDKVRVLEFNAKAGEKIAMHSHPNHVVYNITGGKVKFTMPDGKTMERESQAGGATWVDAGPHAAEMLGPGDAHVILVELKEPGKKMTEHPKK